MRLNRTERLLKAQMVDRDATHAPQRRAVPRDAVFGHACLPWLAALAMLAASCGTDEVVPGNSAAADGGLAGDGAASDGLGQVDVEAELPEGDAASTDSTDADDVAAPDAKPDVSVDAGPDGQSDLPPCAADRCEIDGKCYDADAQKAGDPCRRCMPMVAVDAFVVVSGPCDDGQPCTTGDACDDKGGCVGKPLVCDDGNGCTADACKDGACAKTPNAEACSDGDLCSVGDACKDGACKAGPLKACDDGNPCTTDTCDPKKGCVATNADGPCDDGDACTGEGSCQTGACGKGKAISCDDGDVCTVDACKPKSGCQNTSIAAQCVDDNPCTDAGCDKKLGCVFPFNTLPCDDADVCSKGDTCAVGLCKGVTSAVDDGNPCTDDSCDKLAGPQYVANALPCDDGNACTLGDVCAKKACQPGADKPVCDDGKGCTADSCDKLKGCQFIATTATCDDSDACTSGDVCTGGACLGKALLCDDGNACTTDSCDKQKGCQHALIVSNACRPIIVVDYPPRGATIKSELPFITVKGKVTSGAGAIKSLSLNGKPVKVGVDGAFSHEVVAAIGGNTLELLAEDTAGAKRKRVQAYLWSDSYLLPDAAKPKSGMVDPGVGYFLSKQAIDDGDHSLPPNDLATIFELFLQAYDFGSIIPNPVFSGNGITVNLTDLTYGKAKVTLTPEPGALLLTATIPNVKGKVQAKAFVPLNGNLTIDAIQISAKVKPKVVNNLLVTDISDVKATLVNFNLQLTGVGSLLQFLVNGLKGQLVTSFETSIADALKTQLAPVVSDALSALAFAFDIGVDRLDGSGGKVTAKLTTDFSEVLIDATGAIFRLRAGVYATQANSLTNLGVPKRIGCGKGVQPLVVIKEQPLELSLADDTLNEFLFALWFGGLLEFPVGPELLKGVDLAQYGIGGLKLTTKALLAPTASDCNDSGELLAHIGDFRVDAALDLFGQPMNVVVHASFVAGIKVTVEANKLTISLTEIKSVKTDVEVQQAHLVASEAVIESLVADTLVKNLLAVLGGSALGGFELPVIDLSSTVKGLPKGTGIAIDPKVLTRVNGNTIIGGKLK